MRPHVNGYCGHENVLQTAHKTPLRQQVAATGCNLTTYQPFHAALNTNGNNKWSQNHCYNGVRALQQQQQQQQQLHAKPPTAIHYHGSTANYQQLSHATNLQQNQQHSSPTQYHHQQQIQQQQQQPPQHMHPHLQRLNHFQHGNVNGSTFVAAPQPPPLPLSGATETMTHNYAKLPPHAVNQQRINECAGIPLISNASTHLAPTHRQRLIRKSSQSPPHILSHQAQQHAAAAAAAAAASHQSQLMGLRTEAYASWNLPPTATATANCLSQLTVRAHGLPFLHKNNNNHMNNINNNKNNNNNSNNHWQNLTTHFDNRFTTYVAANNLQAHVNVAKYNSGGKLEKSRLLRYQSSAPAILGSIENTSSISAAGNEESTAVNNSETKIMAETCLPRIIKPRKRRKKDRKPTANNNTTNILISEQQQQQQQQHHQHQYQHNQNSTRTNLKSSNMIDYGAAISKQHKSTEDIFKHFSHNVEIQPSKYNLNANSLMPFYALGSEQLTNKSTTITTKPIINLPWNLNDENNLRSIWDYPLRRSFSDSSATNINLKLCNNIWDSNSSVSSASSSSSSSSASSSSSSSSSYSLSSSTADSFFSADLYASQTLSPSRAEIVGVIGSNRHVNDLTQKQHQQSQQKRNNLKDINVDNIPRKPLLSACLSDSNDSGYGDILTGINIANDLFNHSSMPIATSTTATTTTMNKFNTTSTSVDNFSLLTARTITDAGSASGAGAGLLNTSDEIASLLLLPATAETLLNESINEISRKLIETCGNEPLTDFSDIGNIVEMPHSACFSTCSDFSNDSGIDTNSNNNMNTNNLLNCDELIFNFDNLHMNERNNNNNNLFATPSTSMEQYSTMSKLASTMENFLMHLNSNNDSNNHLNDENNNNTTYAAVKNNNNNSNNNNNNNNMNKNNNEQYNVQQDQQQPQKQQQHNQQFVKNCLNLVWPNGNEEVREPSITTMLNSMVELNTTAFSSH